MTAEDPAARAVLNDYGWEDAGLESLGSGLINATWLATRPDGSRGVLQRVSPVFPPAINLDIDRVGRHLIDRQVRVPRLHRSLAGELWCTQAERTWRLMTWLEGDCHDALASPEQAASAGALLARFHEALLDLQHEFANPRLGVHDTARHLAALEQALQEHAAHPRFEPVAALAADILKAARALPDVAQLPDRIVHGDPKINNLLFDSSSNEAIALVDLDTLGPMPLPLELGDAFRSWCNPMGEDGRTGEFSGELFAAALQGYAPLAAPWISAREVAAIVPATETIMLELAARFCADALNENYFGWDESRFRSRGEHNELRAEGQFTLAKSFARQRAALEELVATLF